VFGTPVVVNIGNVAFGRHVDKLGTAALERNADTDIWRAVCTFLMHSSQH